MNEESDKNDFKKLYDEYTQDCKKNPNADGCNAIKEEILSEYNALISMGANNKIKPTHDEILRLRTELDAKLKAIHDQDDIYDNKRKFDYTMQVRLLLTVLVTTMLFYLFKQL